MNSANILLHIDGVVLVSTTLTIREHVPLLLLNFYRYFKTPIYSYMLIDPFTGEILQEVFPSLN